jgi:hypothetical protein
VNRTNEEITRDLLIREIRRLEADLQSAHEFKRKLAERHDKAILDLEDLRTENALLKAENARQKEELRKHGMLATGKAGLDAYGYYEKNPFFEAKPKPALVRIGQPPADDSERLSPEDFWGPTP